MPLLRLLTLLSLLLGAATAAPAQSLDPRLLFSGGGPAAAQLAPRPPEADPAPPPPPVAAPVMAEAQAMRGAADRAMEFRAHVRDLAAEAPGGWTRTRAALAAQSPSGAPGHFAGTALVTVILILIGRAVGQMVAFTVFRPLMVRAQRAFPAPKGIADKAPVLALRLALTVAFTAIVGLTAAGLGLWLAEDHRPTQITFALILGGYLAFVLADTAWRMILCPYLPAYRIPAIADAPARRLYLWLSALTATAIAGRTYAVWLAEMGLPPRLVAVNMIGLALLALALSVTLVWANRAAISGIILGGDPARATWPQRLGAAAWAPLVTVYLLAAGLEECYRAVVGGPGGTSLLAGLFATLLIGLTAYAAGLYAVDRAFAPRRRGLAIGDGAEPPAPPAAPPPEPETDDDADAGPPSRAVALPPRGMHSFRDLAVRVVGLLALGAAAWTLARIWAGPDAFAPGTTLGVLSGFADILLIGYVAYHAARIWLDRRIADEGLDDIVAIPGDEGGGASAASRLGTLLPLLRSAVLLTIAVSAGVLAAMELGVNVAPLFAGAGVVGLAIGFGAQTLVRDILSGVFFLSDDAFRKGEYIDVGTVKGTVEKISLRSFQLRHHLGPLNTVPFGEITHLTNYSRDWVMMKLPLRLTYDTDPDKVRKLIKKLGERLLEHPTEGHKFVQPLKSQGVYMMEDSAMIIRVKYMTKPGDQWTTRKLVYQEIRELFEREGIHFAHREVTVRLPDLDRGGRPLSDEEARAIGAAARRAVDDADPAAPRSAALTEGR